MPPRQPDGEPGASRLTGAILAGGFSRRLGQDKAALPLGGKPLALWVNGALAPLVASCWLITNQPLAHLAFGLPLLTDLRPFQGPAGGLLTALFWARTPWVLAAAVDNPFLAPALLAELAARTRRTSRPAVVCRSPGAWSRFPGSTPSACCPPYRISSRPTAAPPVSWRFAGPRSYLSRKFWPWTPKAGAFLTSILPGT